jgi:hypothetical protein
VASRQTRHRCDIVSVTISFYDHVEFAIHGCRILVVNLFSSANERRSFWLPARLFTPITSSMLRHGGCHGKFEVRFAASGNPSPDQWKSAMKLYAKRKLKQRSALVEGRWIIGINPAGARYDAVVIDPYGIPAGRSC